MKRRQMLAGLAASALGSAEVSGQKAPSYLELKTWRLHNSAENQGQRVAEYLEHALEFERMASEATDPALRASLLSRKGFQEVR